MGKEADMNITCRQCGKEFIFTKAEQEFYELKGFTAPGRCKECRSSKQSQHHHLVCSQCGEELDNDASICCTACLENIQLEFEQRNKKREKVASAAQAKLQVTESQKAELDELLRQKEQLVEELELKVNELSQDLEKAHQFSSALGTLQPTLHSIGERLEALERAQNRINERMLQLAERVHEMYESTSLLEVIKRSLRPYQREDT